MHVLQYVRNADMHCLLKRLPLSMSIFVMNFSLFATFKVLFCKIAGQLVFRNI